MASTVFQVRGECALTQMGCSGHTEAAVGWEYVLVVEPTGLADWIQRLGWEELRLTLCLGA